MNRIDFCCILYYQDLQIIKKQNEKINMNIHSRIMHCCIFNIAPYRLLNIQIEKCRDAFTWKRQNILFICIILSYYSLNFIKTADYAKMFLLKSLKI